MAERPSASYIVDVTSSLYSRDILRLAASLPQSQRLGEPDASAQLSSPVCGSQVTIDVMADPNGLVAEIGQEVRACALGQASAALMMANAVGRSAEELAYARNLLRDYLAGRRSDPGDWPGLEVFADARRYPARHGSILLAFEAASEAASSAASAIRLGGAGKA